TGSLSPSWTLFDVKGQSLRQVSDGFTVDSSKTRFVLKETEYDLLGRITRTSVPHEVNDPAMWNTSEYDDLGRVCASTAINGLRTETLFTGRADGGGTVTVLIDPKRQLSAVSPAGAVILSCGHPFPTAFYHANGLNQRTSSTVNMRKQMLDSVD